MSAVTMKQIALLHHTLGVTPERREPFRNHFVAGPGHHDQSDLEALEAAALMVRGRAPAFCDPTDVVFRCTEAGEAYALDNLPVLPPPPRRSKWDQYMDDDYGHSFADWLGIELPRVESDYRGNYRYTRVRYFHDWAERIEGEWKPTKKDAKASYKVALKKRSDELRAWRKPEIAA